MGSFSDPALILPDSVGETELKSKQVTIYKALSWGIKGNAHTDVAGIWGPATNASATDADDVLLDGATAGYFINATLADADEAKWPDLVLNKGTYLIVGSYARTASGGKVDIMHGASVLGTLDCYAAVTDYNQVFSISYSPTIRTSADFRLVVNGKNIASSGYRIRIQRLEFIRTA